MGSVRWTTTRANQASGSGGYQEIVPSSVSFTDYTNHLVMVMAIAAAGGITVGGSDTPQSNWTLIGSGTTPDGAHYWVGWCPVRPYPYGAGPGSNSGNGWVINGGYALYQPAGGGSFTVTPGYDFQVGSGEYSVAYALVDGVGAVDAYNTATTLVAPALTATVVDDILISGVLGYAAASNDANTWTVPSGMTLGSEGPINTFYRRRTRMATLTGLSTGSTGTKTWAVSPSLSSDLAFSLLLKPSAPTVTSVSANSGSTGGGYSVTITGDWFTGATGVTFDGVAATNVVVNSGQSITCTVPAHVAGAVTVAVTTAIGTGSLASAFTYTSMTISTLTVGSGPTAGMTSVGVTGTNFTGATGATLGGVAVLNFRLTGATTASFETPAHAAGATDLVIINAAESVTKAAAFTYVAPTIATLSRSKGSTYGGEAITITGTGFTGVTSVTFGGTAATALVIASDTSLSCVIPAHAAGAVTVAVLDPGDSASVAAAYTFLQVLDATVKLVKGGVVSGDNKADVANDWPSESGVALYGGSTDLWGTTLTAADMNASDTGVVLSATVGPGAQANVLYAEMTTYYTVTGLGDLPQLLCALTVNTDGQTTALDIYELPRGNLGLANDPNANRAVSDAWFYLSRILKPSRAIAKLWRELEFWLELLPTSNIPGFQVWAAADEGSFIQLRDGNGDAVTIRSEGAHRVFFPPDTTATGHYVQLKLGVPATAGSEQKVAVKVRDMVLRGVWQPISTERVDCTLVLSGDALIGGNPSARSVRQQEADLIAAQAQDAPVPFTDIDGTAGYGVITDLKFRTVKFKEGSESVRLATMTLWKLLYQ